MPKFTIFMAKKDELLNPETPIASSPVLGTRLPDQRAGTTPHGSRPGDRQQHPARAQQRPSGAADVRRRHNPSSRFRG
jgi:hypothetical protein